MTNKCSMMLISECVVRKGVDGQLCQKIVFTNNIFNQSCNSSGCNLINGIVEAQFLNNIFLHNGYSGCGGGCPPSKTLVSVTNSYFYNNIFKQTSNDITYGNNFQSYCTGNFYMFNVFEGDNTQDWLDVNSNYSQNNQFNVSMATLFMNQSGNIFNYSNNYHLQNPNLYTGNDGTQIGIFGGPQPWKEGSIPFNPHVQTKNISTTTNQNGNLPINIKVAAQDH